MRRPFVKSRSAISPAKLSKRYALNREIKMSELSELITNQMRTLICDATEDPNIKLNNGLRLLAKWRSLLIQNTLLEKNGVGVLQGPLKGLNFVEQSSEGCHVAKLLGCYEQPLQPYLLRAINRNYGTLINIGCAEGYYAVGLAVAMPNTNSLAFDTDENAQKACADLAKKNGVADRVKIGKHFNIQKFADYESHNALVLCDIEGAERDLLDPIKAPALSNLDIIVESHECLVRGITEELTRRFSSSHNIIRVNDNGQRSLEEAPKWFAEMAHLDQLLATWEWRSGPTPWLVMDAKNKKELE